MSPCKRCSLSANAHFRKSARHRRAIFSRTSESEGHQQFQCRFRSEVPQATLPRVSQGLQIGGTGASNGPGSTELPFILFVTFVSAFVAGLFGFAVGLVATSLWLYVLTPLLSATLIVGI
jgi:hypothetical protein